MNSIKALRLACVLFAGMAFFSCSDSGSGGGGSKEERANSAGKTEDGHDVLVFQEGSLDNILTKTDTISITDTSFAGTLIFKNMKTDEIPNVGDIINSAATENAPYGFLYKVLGVSTKDGITAVVVRGASLEEAIEDVDFESETEIDFDEEGNPLEMRMKTSNLPAALQKSSTPLLSEHKVLKLNLGNNIKDSIDASVKYTAKLNFDISIKDWKLKSAKLSLSQDADLTVKGAVAGNINASKLYQIAKVSLPKITFWVGWVYVSIHNDLKASLKIAGKAEVGMDFKFTLKGGNEYGFEYKDGSINKISKSDFSRTLDYEQYVDGDVRVGIVIGMESRLYGLTGLALDAGPALALRVNAKPVGVFVFNEGFSKEYALPGEIDYEDLDNIDGIADNLELILQGSLNQASNILNRKIENEARLAFGTDIGMRLTLRVLGHSLIDHVFAEAFIEHATLYRTSFLPLFSKPKVSETAAGIKVESGVIRDFLNYPVHKVGFCIEKAANECKNENGIRQTFAAGIGVGKKLAFEASFDGLEKGTYYIMPYFENGIGGTYYDKATTFTVDSTPSSSSVIDVPSSSSAVVPSSSSVLASSSSVVQSSSSGIIYGSPVTYGGETYQTVVIGTQTWMARNLNYNVNGSRCGGEGDDELSADSIAKNCAIYGRLYDWTTAMLLESSCNSAYCASQVSAKHKGICPSGWHIPNGAEWAALIDFTGGSDAGAGKKLKSTNGWPHFGGGGTGGTYTVNMNGTDDYGFAALPGVTIEYASLTDARWWTSTEDNNNNYNSAYYATSVTIDMSSYIWEEPAGYKLNYYFIRCLKD